MQVGQRKNGMSRFDSRSNGEIIDVCGSGSRRDIEGKREEGERERELKYKLTKG